MVKSANPFRDFYNSPEAIRFSVMVYMKRLLVSEDELVLDWQRRHDPLWLTHRRSWSRAARPSFQAMRKTSRSPIAMAISC